MIKVSDKELQAKIEALGNSLSELGSVLVAYSGGVDSSFLAAFAHEVLGDRMLAVIATSPTYSSREFEAAKKLAEERGIPYRVIDSNELEIEGFASNPPQRCYFCKGHLFSELKELAAELGFDVVVDGTNADDKADFRPGRKAALELGTLSPLLEYNFSKEDIRAASRAMLLPTAGKPAFACLASRFQYGHRITAEKLVQVDAIENFLFENGFHQFRARHHEEILRLELDDKGIARMLDPELRAALVKLARENGFSYVTLDLQGYRTGSANERLSSEEKRLDLERDVK